MAAEGKDVATLRAVSGGSVKSPPRPDGSDRYGIYVIEGAPSDPRLLAETSREGIGIAVVTLHEEGEFERPDGTMLPVGVLDRLRHKWIINPWAGRRRA